jgi:hypothetical protein
MEERRTEIVGAASIPILEVLTSLSLTGQTDTQISQWAVREYTRILFVHVPRSLVRH